MGMTGTYSASIWDSEDQRWEQRYSGITKWGLRQVIRELRRKGWSDVSTLIEAESAPECVICGREEGSEVDVAGFPDGVPLGTIEACETCGRLACPDCLHETDCCFLEAEEHADDPEWAPPGWVKAAEQSHDGQSRNAGQLGLRVGWWRPSNMIRFIRLAPSID
jgi:hypothetical protein